MQKKLFLLDAYALVFRAYYALIRNPRITSKGRNTNAQFGFTNTLVDLINNQKPTHMAVCFDTAAATERHTDFADYKANRQETPEDISSAVPDIIRIIEALNIPVVAIDGYEADDVIGALAKQAELAGYEVFMVTPDKDYAQLVSENIKIYKPPYQGGTIEIMGPKEVCEKWGINNVSQVIDILGLMGDAVDNIPGIKGVGEKTAAKLLAEYETLENILANADNIKGSLGEKIRGGKEAAIMSKKLATIITDIPAAVFHEEDFRIKEMNKEALKEVFAELEFRALTKRLLGEEAGAPADQWSPKTDDGQTVTGNQKTKAKADTNQLDLFGNVVATPATSIAPFTIENSDGSSEDNFLAPDKNIHNTPHNYILLNDDAAIQQFISTASEQTEICFDSETTGLDANEAELVGLSFAFKEGEAYYVPCPADRESCITLLKKFQVLFDDVTKVWVGQNVKYDMLMLKWYGFELKGNIFDTMLAHYVIEPDGKRNMDALSAKYLGYEPVHIEELIGKKGKGQGNMRDVEIEKIKEYAAEDADITLRLKKYSFTTVKNQSGGKSFLRSGKSIGESVDRYGV